MRGHHGLCRAASSSGPGSSSGAASHAGREWSLGKVLEALLSRALENWCDEAVTSVLCALGPLGLWSTAFGDTGLFWAHAAACAACVPHQKLAAQSSSA